MSNLLALIKDKRKVLAAKMSGRGINTAKLPTGISYLRIFPNVADHDGTFFQSYGMHFVETTVEGKKGKVAVLCKSATHDTGCEICEGLMEAKAVHKGNKAMEDTISEIRASLRFLVNGAITLTPSIESAEKTEIIELPMSVFDSCLKIIEEDMSDEIGNPLDATKGYCFKINKTGDGRTTDYEVSPSRKDGRAAIPEKLMTASHDLLSFVENQYDVNKLTQVAKATGVITGVSIAVSSTLSLSATGTDGSAASLPGFSSSAASTASSASAVSEAVAEAAAVEYKEPKKEELKSVAEPAGDNIEDDQLADMMKELEGL